MPSRKEMHHTPFGTVLAEVPCDAQSFRKQAAFFVEPDPVDGHRRASGEFPDAQVATLARLAIPFHKQILQSGAQSRVKPLSFLQC